MLCLLGKKTWYKLEKLNNQSFYVMDTSDLTMECTTGRIIRKAIEGGISFDNCKLYDNDLQLQSLELLPKLYEYGNLMVHYIDWKHVNIIYNDMLFSYDGTCDVAIINDKDFVVLQIGNRSSIRFNGFSFFGRGIRQGKETNIFYMVLGGILCSLNLDTLELRTVFDCFTDRIYHEDRLRRYKDVTVWTGSSNIRHCTVSKYKRHIIIKGSY